MNNLLSPDTATPARQAFWGEMSPCEHSVQIYGNDAVFLNALEEFVSDGLQARESVIVIATQAHRDALAGRLKGANIDLSTAAASDRYISLDAEETLSKFLLNGWPDEQLFEQVVIDLLARARGRGRKVRAFGEMVALMWERGLNGATVRLEFLWHQFCQKEGFSLFCAYPRSGFTQDAEASIKEICAAHSLVVAG